MCAIIGALVVGNDHRAWDILESIWALSYARGRDGRGYVAGFCDSEPHVFKDHTRAGAIKPTLPRPPKLDPFGQLPLTTFIANLRAEPTTEYVADKSNNDQQPYTAGAWSIVHNGTIANDQDLRTHLLKTRIDSACIAEQLDAMDLLLKGRRSFEDTFTRAISHLKGSYAILATRNGCTNHLFAAVNYRPLWYIVVPKVGVFVASAREYFPGGYNARMLPPYSTTVFKALWNGEVEINTRTVQRPVNNKALVICSGGLDSVVAATWTQKILGMDVSLLHFQYGSRAQHPEAKAIVAVAEALGINEIIQQNIDVYRKEDSPLLRADSTIAGGEAGAEFAHEWVPARNLLMLSIATAIAEARGFETLVLGNNLEEAGAYPDNEPEFIAKFNDILPFAIGDGKRLQVLMPVGNLMKHEIVELGVKLGAPMHATWSCYRAGPIHCGTCGPCYMRKTAFEINKEKDTVKYEV